MADTATTDTTKTKRDRVWLKSGMGSVAAEDYDEKVHGKALDLSDEEFEARQRGVIPGVTIPKGAPLTTQPIQARATGVAAPVTTTITGLQSADPVPPATPVTMPPAPIGSQTIGKPVVTTEPVLEHGQIRVTRNGTATVIKEADFNAATDTRVDTGTTATASATTRK